MDLSAVILAGGESRRMGRDKAWVELAGQPLLELAVENVRRLGVQEVLISGRTDGDYSALKCPVLFDLQPGLGPLGGIERALFVCNTPRLLVLAVDLPCMTSAFLHKLVNRCDRFGGAVPKLAGELEPLAAIYPKRCHAFASKAITTSRCGARDFALDCLREHAVRTLSVAQADAGCFANWNEPGDMLDPLK